MGISHTLHAKDGFEIALDDDGNFSGPAKKHKVALSVGTGFTSWGKSSVNVEICLSIEELTKINEKISNFIKCMESFHE